MAKRRYRNNQDEEAVGFLILFLLSYVLKFIVSYWRIIVIIIIFITVFFLVFHYRKNIKNIYLNSALKKLKNKSILYKQIININSKYNFEILKDFTDSYFIKSKSELENCNIDNYLMMTIHNRYNDLVNYKKKYDYFLNKYNYYLNEYSVLKKYINDEDAKNVKMNYKKYYKYQNMLYENERINRNYKFRIIIFINYRSTKGKVRKSRYKIYESDEFLKFIKQYQQLKNNKRLYEISSKIERSKMSVSLRYDILKRDHFKCSICGKGKEDGVKLEVDHIIPVSRGGKTEMSNLQTLCETCNRGKSNKI